MLDVVERVAAHGDQVGALADFHRAELVGGAAQFGGVAGGGQQRLARGGAVLHPQADLEQRGVAQRTEIGAERHLHAGLQRALEPRAMLAHRRLGAGVHRGREVALLDVALLARARGLRRREVRDAERGHVPGVALAEKPERLVVHHVAVLHAVGPEAQRRLHRLGVGRVGHDLHPPLAADAECRLQLGVGEERVPVAVPGRPDDAAGQVELDVVHAALDLLADGGDERLRPVARLREAGGEGVAGGRREEPAAREDARTDETAGVERALEGDVDEVRRAGGTHGRHPASAPRSRPRAAAATRSARGCPTGPAAGTGRRDR